MYVMAGGHTGQVGLSRRCSSKYIPHNLRSVWSLLAYYIPSITSLSVPHCTQREHMMKPLLWMSEHIQPVAKVKMSVLVKYQRCKWWTCTVMKHQKLNYFFALTKLCKQDTNFDVHCQNPAHVHNNILWVNKLREEFLPKHIKDLVIL